jgi:hypothetical protein
LLGKESLVLMKQVSVGCVRGRNAGTSIRRGQPVCRERQRKSMIRGTAWAGFAKLRLTHSNDSGWGGR